MDLYPLHGEISNFELHRHLQLGGFPNIPRTRILTQEELVQTMQHL